jgi:hypothetical protein
MHKLYPSQAMKRTHLRKRPGCTLNIAPMKACLYVVGIILFMQGEPSAHAQAIPADLVIESIQIQPLRPTAADSVNLIGVVRNSGSVSVENFSVSLSLFKNKKLFKKIQDIPSLVTLPPSGSGLSIPIEVGLLPEGDYQALMVVDEKAKIQESNKQNNTYPFSFHIWPAPYRDFP